MFIAGGPVDYKRLATLSWLDKQMTDAVPVISKVAVDQLFWCPIFMSVFFAYLGLVNGDGLAAIGAKIRNDLTAVQA